MCGKENQWEKKWWDKLEIKHGEGNENREKELET